jgi:hypothetical protein
MDIMLSYEYTETSRMEDVYAKVVSPIQHSFLWQSYCCFFRELRIVWGKEDRGSAELHHKSLIAWIF